jgi:hypothetical protein
MLSCNPCRSSLWLGIGVFLVELWSRRSPVNCWPNSGWTLGKHWSDAGQTLVGRWSNAGRTLGKHWSDAGQTLVGRWSNVDFHRGHAASSCAFNANQAPEGNIATAGRGGSGRGPPRQGGGATRAQPALGRSRGLSTRTGPAGRGPAEPHRQRWVWGTCMVQRGEPTRHACSRVWKEEMGGGAGWVPPMGSP